MQSTSKAIALLLLFVGTSCGSDFAPYNLLEDLRVLAIRAEPPVLGPGESTALDALVWEPQNRTVDYQWSWCPLTQSRDTGFECAVTEAEVQATLDEVMPSSGITVDYDLGNDPIAILTYPGNATALQAICEGLLTRATSSVSGAISCDDGIDLTVRLVVSTAESSVTAIKRVTLVLDPNAATNTNPVLGPTVRIANKDERDEANAFEIATDGSDVIAADSDYRFWADISASTFESFVPPPDALTPEPSERRESLFLTWFVTSGETEAGRTSFIDGETTVDDLRENVWRIAPLAEIPSRIVTLFLVLRDERGGVTWLERSVAVEETSQ